MSSPIDIHMGHSEFQERALEETMSLLSRVVFTPFRGAYLAGELTAISVMVDAAEEAGLVRFRVMCHDTGHIGIDWDGLPVVMIDRTTGDERIQFLDRRGRAELVAAIPAENQLGFARIAPGGVTAVEVPRGMLTGHFAAADVPQVRRVEGQSRDGNISAVAEVVGQGHFHISVKAETPELRNAVVQVILRSGSNPADVWLSQKLSLNIGEGSTGVWSGRVGVGELQGRFEDATLLVFPCR